MRNTLVSPARRAARPASTASLLLLLPLALAALGAQAQSLPEVATDVATVTAPASDAAPDEAVGPPAGVFDPGEAVDAAAPVSGASQALSDVAVPVDAVPVSDVAGVREAVTDVAGTPATASAEVPALSAPPADSAAVGAEVATATTPAEPVDTIVDGVSVPTTQVIAAEADADSAATPETKPTPAPVATTPSATPAPAPAPAPATSTVSKPAETTEAVIVPVAAEATDAAPAAVPPAPAAMPTTPTPRAEAAAPPIAPVAPKPVFVNVDNAIERQLGARCPNDLAARMATQGELLVGACQGAMPAHLAAVLIAIPEAQIHLPRAWRERELSQRAWFKAVPGDGQRPDFLAVQDKLWVRSFEGADPNTTVYLVSAPFECVDGRLLDADAAEPVRVPAGSCRQAFVQERVYRVIGNAAPVDITAEVMPARPVLGEAEKKRYVGRGGRLTLDHSKLQYGPAMRWYVRFDEGSASSEPRSFGEWNRVHQGFVVWTGQRFETRDTLPRSQWPCDPVAPGDAACGGFADAGRDPFVLGDAGLVRSESATP